MKIVVIGGTGRVGSKLVGLLREHGHEVLAAAPSSGVNTITGEGVADAVSGAAVVVDVSNSPSFDDRAAVLEFFSTSSHNLLKAEAVAGVGHHVAMSVVGADRLPDSGYLRAKVEQEQLIADSSIPYSIVRATLFFEFIDSIAAAATDGDTVRVSPMLIEPMAVDDVVWAVGRVAVGTTLFRSLVRRALSARHDPRVVVADPHARYFGTELAERSLVAGPDAQLGATRFDDWLVQSLTTA